MLKSASRARRLSITEIVESALAELAPVDVAVVDVTPELYRTINTIARRRGVPMAEVMDAAITAKLDDAARWIEPPGKPRRKPMVAHASRRAA